MFFNEGSIVKTGVFTGLSNQDYHAGPGYSKTQLDMVAQSPALLPWSKSAPRDESSDAARIGTALHMLLLEPEVFAKSYIAEPGKFDLRTTAGKAARAEFEAEAAGRVVLGHDEWEMLQRQRDSVMAHPEARGLIEVAGVAEASAYWVDPDTGLLCRCRPDWWPYQDVMVDIKSTEDPSPRAFGKSVHEYRYHVQDAFYMDGASIASGTQVEEFFFLAIGKKRELGRYPVRVYRLRDEDRELGRSLYKSDLSAIRECELQGQWPGIEELALPAYAYK